MSGEILMHEAGAVVQYMSFCQESSALIISKIYSNGI